MACAFPYHQDPHSTLQSISTCLAHLDTAYALICGAAPEQASLCRSLTIDLLTGDSVVPHLGEFIRPVTHCCDLEKMDIWANKIESYAGLWGVGLGGIHLPKLHTLSLRGSPSLLHLPHSVFAAKPHDKVVDAFAGTSPLAYVHMTGQCSEYHESASTDFFEAQHFASVYISTAFRCALTCRSKFGQAGAARYWLARRGICSRHQMSGLDQSTLGRPAHCYELHLLPRLGGAPLSPLSPPSSLSTGAQKLQMI